MDVGCGMAKAIDKNEMNLDQYLERIRSTSD